MHLGGSACDLDTILPIGARRGIPVVEDACQAHLAEWRGRKVGTYGQAGCFSFQASKNLNCGEGGAILCNDEDLFERCYRFHNNGTGLKRIPNRSYDSSGANLRMPEFQAALLTAQMARIEAQAATRTSNATYLTSMLNQITGIAAARMYDGCTRNAYHLYMFRYDKSQFAGLPRSAFLKALAAEGIPASGGYRPLNAEPFLNEALNARGYKRLFPAKTLSEWHERNRCPVNDRVCEEAVWFSQYILLAPRKSMELIADAIRKIQVSADRLPRRRTAMRTFARIVSAWLLAAAWALAQTPKTSGEEIRSLLDSTCVSCHSGAQAAGGLSLDSPAGIAKGGKSGAVVVPGNASCESAVPARRFVRPGSANAARHHAASGRTDRDAQEVDRRRSGLACRSGSRQRNRRPEALVVYQTCAAAGSVREWRVAEPDR